MTAAARRGRRSGAKTDHIDALEIARITARDDDLPAPRCRMPPMTCSAWSNRREPSKTRVPSTATTALVSRGYHTSTGTLTSPKGLDRRLRRHHHTSRGRAKIARRARHRGLPKRHQLHSRRDRRRPMPLQDQSPLRHGNGTAPIEASSGRVVRHRLNRGGNRHPHRRHRPDPQTRHRGPRQLERLVVDYIDHYNTHRPHRSLDQPPPVTTDAADQPDGHLQVVRTARCGGLINEYRNAA